MYFFCRLIRIREYKQGFQFIFLYYVTKLTFYKTH